jgi:hypothetical protein
MTQADLEKGLLVIAAWRLAKSNDPNELLAIMSVIRNWVVPRYGVKVEPMVQETYYKSYSAAIADFFEIYPTRGLPAINEPALIDPVEGLLLKVDSCYSCDMVDTTSSRAFPGGARYFGRAASPTEWFQRTVLARQDVHPLIGSFGSVQMFA